MTRRTRRPEYSSWQKLLLDELAKLVADRPQEIQILEGPAGGGGDQAVVRIKLDTSEIPRSAEGLQLRDAEEFIVGIPTSPFALPRVEVDHRRFLGEPHVLQGMRLCIYLDPSREWQPPKALRDS